ncbi:MAG: hypothetical protein LBM99_02145 [Bacillales bacterium]|jgi:superoxide reductase|nr:hypothetical protein [Bacillales bacterium]
MAPRFFRCKHCGNIITLLEDSQVPLVCCGEKMVELVPNSMDGANEKHVPIVKVIGKSAIVEVGSVIHPSTAEHHISFIVLETTSMVQIKYLQNTERPITTFLLADGEKVVKVFEYCNLHGLWSN